MTWTLKSVAVFALAGALGAFALGWGLASFFDQYDQWRGTRRRRF